MQVARHLVRRPAAAAAIALALLAVAGAAPAGAQTAAATKVGVVNVGAISGKILETKDLQADLTNEQQLLDAAVKGHQAQLEDQKQQLRNFKVGSDQYKQKFNDLQDTATKFNIEDQQRKNRLVNEVVERKRQLYVELQEAVANIAKQRGLDLVIVEPEMQMPASAQGMDPQQFETMMSQKTVLFASPKVDLTEEVVAAMDMAYKARGGGGGGAGGSAAPAK